MSITSLPNVELDKLRAQVEQLKRQLPVLMEYHQLSAKLCRTRYDALVAEGFNPQQALELCRDI